MVTNKTTVRSVPSSEPAKLTMPATEANSKLNERIEEGKELHSATVNSMSMLDENKRKFTLWDSYNTEMLRRMFTTAEVSENYSRFASGTYSSARERDVGQAISSHRHQIVKKIVRLEAIVAQLELFEIASQAAAPDQLSEPRTVRTGHDNRVFIVHGHDHGTRDAVALLLTTLGLKPVILSDEPNSGRTIIEKFEHSADVGFAIVLLTADDVGGKDKSALQSRARQNVILELGYFVGSLTRARVCALYKSNVELPSDIIGVGYVPLDPDGHWKYPLAKELRAAGYNVDLNLL